MISFAAFLLFLAAALVIALTPGPGIFYVASRTLAEGRSAGLASSIGTGLGGLVHVLAGALGVSALVLASAQAFALLKLAGAAYLVYLGVTAIRTAGQPLEADLAPPEGRPALRQGIVVEALNPKTAVFFLAFIPQFVDPAGPVALQFVLLGALSVALNTGVDIAVVHAAAALRGHLARHPGWVRRLRQGSGTVMCGLGAALALARRPAT